MSTNRHVSKLHFFPNSEMASKTTKNSSMGFFCFVLFCFVFGSMHQKLNTSKTSLLVVCILNKHMFKENHRWTHLLQDVKICIFAFASKTVNLFICRWKPGTLHFRKKKKSWRCCFVSCHMFSELFIIERSLRRALFCTPLTKACPSLLKNHTQQYCLPGFTVLMKIWSRAQKLSGKVPEISLSQMFQQKVLACHSLIRRHTGLSVTTAI